MKTLQITIVALLSITLLSSSVAYAEDMMEDGPIQNSTNHVYEDMTDDNETMEEWPIVIQLRAMIAELEAKIAELQEDKQNKNAKIAELRDKLKAKNNQAENQDAKLQAKLDKKNAKIAELEEIIDNKDAKITHLKEKVDRKIANKQEKVGAMNIEKQNSKEDMIKMTGLHQGLLENIQRTSWHAYDSSGYNFEKGINLNALIDILDIQKEDLPLPPSHSPITPTDVQTYWGTMDESGDRVGEVGSSFYIIFTHHPDKIIEITEPNNNVVSLNVTIFGGLGHNTPGVSWINYQLTQVGNYTWQELDENGEVEITTKGYHNGTHYNYIPNPHNGTITVYEHLCDSTAYTCYGDPLWDGLIKGGYGVGNTERLCEIQYWPVDSRNYKKYCQT